MKEKHGRILSDNYICQMRSAFLPILFLLFVIGLGSCHSDKVDLIIKQAHIYTVDAQFSTATTLVIKDGKILAIGDDHLLDQYQSDSVIDAQGRFIYPGLIDAHCHFSGYALDKLKVDVSCCHSVTEIIKACQQHAQQHPSSWIEGRQWDETQFNDKSVLCADSLDRYFPTTPVFILRIDGHAAVCNSAAMALAQIKPNAIIKGGKVDLHQGKLSGVLFDNAIHQVQAVLPKLSANQSLPFFKETEQEFFQFGLTSFVDCMVENDWMHALEKAYQEKILSIKGCYILTNNPANRSEYLNVAPYRGKDYHISGFKVFADGSLGSRGACLLQPYDDAESHGYLTTSMDSLRDLAEKIKRNKYQLLVHAIGDSTNRAVLKLMGEVLKTKNDKRWRIEHAQVISPNDLSLFKTYSIIPSVQPTHATSDMRWVNNRLGKARSKTAYAYQQLLQQNQWLPLGTDFPVEHLNPLYTFYAAVFRQDDKGYPIGGFQMENALSRKEALQGMTIWAAQSAFREHELGSLEVGKAADFIILPVDLMKDDAQRIRNAKIIATYLNGKAVYRSRP